MFTRCIKGLQPFLKKMLFVLAAAFIVCHTAAQRGFNYYRDSLKNGSPSTKAFTYFKKAYYDHIWQWSKAGADSAVYYLQLAIKEDPDYVSAYAFLAHVYQFKTYDNEDWEQKLALEKKYAEKAMSYNPKTGDAYSVMSDIKWHEKDTAAALGLLRRAIAQEPDNVGNYVWIAIRLRQTGMYYDSAVYYLRRLAQLDPEYGQAYMKLGNVYQFDKRQSDSAVLYYHKAIAVYNNIKPKDLRMMDAYYWLGELYATEKKYDSAIAYYSLFLKEMEPSSMYIREMRLSATYQALYDCYRNLSGNYLNKFITLNQQRIAGSPGDGEFLLGILESMVAIGQDSVTEKYALPLSRHLQAMRTGDTLTHLFAAFNEYLLLKSLKRNQEAIKVLETLHAKNPNEPNTLFQLGRNYILSNKVNQGISYLRSAKLHLNNTMALADYLGELKKPDFDKVKNLAAFKQLLQ